MTQKRRQAFNSGHRPVYRIYEHIFTGRQALGQFVDELRASRYRESTILALFRITLNQDVLQLPPCSFDSRHVTKERGRRNGLRHLVIRSCVLARVRIAMYSVRLPWDYYPLHY